MHLRKPYECPLSHLAIPVPANWKVAETTQLAPNIHHTVIVPGDYVPGGKGEYIGFTVAKTPPQPMDLDDKTSARGAIMSYVLMLSQQYGAAMTLETIGDTSLLGDAVKAGYSRFSYSRDSYHHTEALWMFHVNGYFLQLRFRCPMNKRREYTEMLTQLHREVKEIAQPTSKEPDDGPQEK